MKYKELFFIVFLLLPAIAFKAQADSVVVTGQMRVTGRLRVGDNNAAAVKGNIRWNDTTNDFEGFNGVEWLSLTATAASNDLDGSVQGLGALKNYVPATSSDGTASDVFGCSVAISGDYAIIGARSAENASNIGTGAAYIFKRSGQQWVQHQKLLASDGALDDFFGVSVDISGNYAIVGASLDDDNGTNSGSAYIFKLTGTTWSEFDKITASDAADGDVFGSPVAISGLKAVVGASGNDDVGSNSGSAYVFNEGPSAWTEAQKLTASNAATLARFGTSLDITTDRLIVGAYPGGLTTGAAYVFFFNGSVWSEQAILNPPLPSYFGYGVSVTLNNDFAVVGSNLDTSFAIASAFIFKRNGTTWPLQKEYNGENYSNFGIRVNLQGQYLLVSATSEASITGCTGSPLLNAGRVYVFKNSNGVWYEHLIISDPLAANGNLFGIGIGVSGSDIVIGSQTADPNGVSNQGASMFARIE